MKKSHSIGVVFSLCLICMFAVLSVILIYMGNEAYNHVIHTKEHNNDCRVTLSYLAGKVRTADSTDGITIRKESGVDVLSVSDGDCETLIYFTGGEIYEAYIFKGDDFELDFGEKIADVKKYNVEISGDMVKFRVTTNNNEELYINVCIPQE